MLLSSHITSDLDRIADRVWPSMAAASFSICLAKKLPIWRESPIALQNRLTRFSNASKKRSLSDAKFSCDVLVPNRFEFAEAFPEIPCDHASIEDYLRFTLKGIAQ